MVGQVIKLLCMFFEDFSGYFDFRLWDGTIWTPPLVKEKRATVVINNPYVVADIFLFPVDLKLGEAFLCGDIDIEGDIYAVFPAEDHIYRKYRRLMFNPTFWRLVLSLKGKRRPVLRRNLDARGPAELYGKEHSLERDRRAIEYHYDLPVEFYSLYLDPLMNYSCAYFRNSDEDLATAQLNKLELVCRKICLKKGDRVLDVGCGWGGFLFYAAKYYGAKVLGITLSERQYRYVRNLILRERLQDNAEVRLMDYREVSGQFDKIVSIGMFEHVGKKMIKTYFKKMFDLLKPGGVFLNHGIAADWSLFRRYFRRFSFVERYVFPDGDLFPVSYVLRVAEDVGFEVRDVESLREHYALTLRRWVENLSRNKKRAVSLVGESVYRTWVLYMAGASYGFSVNKQSVYQSLLIKPGHDGSHDLPSTREHIYKDWKLPLDIQSLSYHNSGITSRR